MFWVNTIGYTDSFKTIYFGNVHSPSSIVTVSSKELGVICVPESDTPKYTLSSFSIFFSLLVSHKIMMFYSVGAATTFVGVVERPSRRVVMLQQIERIQICCGGTGTREPLSAALTNVHVETVNRKIYSFLFLFCFTRSFFRRFYFCVNLKPYYCIEKLMHGMRVWWPCVMQL